MSRRDGNDRIFETLRFLHARFPKAFSRKRGEIRPLKPGILDDVVAELGAEAFREPVKLALSFYTTRLHYLSKVVSGKWYRDLHGHRFGIIPEEAKAEAQRKHHNIMANNRPAHVRSVTPDRTRHHGSGDEDLLPD